MKALLFQQYGIKIEGFYKKVFLMLNGSNAIYDICFWTIQAFQVAETFFFKSDSLIITILLEISSFQRHEVTNKYPIILLNHALI